MHAYILLDYMYLFYDLKFSFYIAELTFRRPENVKACSGETISLFCGIKVGPVSQPIIPRWNVKL